MKKEISIKELRINSFKGVKALTINFDSQTNIFGANGTGKTTVFDAFTWLLFGKDSTERKDFNVKTLDKTGKSKPMVECEVSAILVIDGQENTLKRVLKEDWVTKRGTTEKEFKGNTTNLYWNEVPMTVTDFTRKVNDVVDEIVFKIITRQWRFC
jgi:DNA repair exonuclease SbcCD ATPase subunit